MSTDVTVIIPVYNVELYVEECLKSVMAQQTTASMECIVVDDRGSDSSMDIVRNIIDDYSGPISFRIIEREKNGGLSAARNTGIRAASGRYIYLLDSDDIITPDCIESLKAVADRYPGVEIVTGDFQTFPEKDVHRDLSLQDKNFPEFSEDKAWIRSILLSVFPVTAWNKLISKDFIDRNNLYFKEGILHEDNHWHASAYHVISKIAFVEKVLYLYRMRPGSITLSSDAAEKRVRNMAIIYGEMFAKKVQWDQPWAKWAFQSLCLLKFSKTYNPDSEQTKKALKSSALALSKNSSCPLSMRMLFVYFTFPPKLFFARVLYGVFNRLLPRLPLCSSR